MSFPPAARIVALLAVSAVPLPAVADVRDEVRAKIAAESPSLRVLYEHLHANPELSWMDRRRGAGAPGQEVKPACRT